NGVQVVGGSNPLAPTNAITCLSIRNCQIPADFQAVILPSLFVSGILVVLHLTSFLPLACRGY
ncbi:MAG: hypothetical protein AB7T01_04410, partial [Acidithiobacillus sp.]